jgi:serine/threonine-protein kinase
VLFTNASRGGLDEYQIEIYSLETDKREVLFKGGTYARYVPSGHIVYVHRETLYAVRFDLERLEVVGPAVPVVPDVTMSDTYSGSAQFAICGDGTLAYVPVQARSANLKPVWVDRGGRVEPLPGAPRGNYSTVAISPDGERVALTILDGDKGDVWIYDLERDTVNPLTSGGDGGFPVWAPDGKRVIFSSRDYELCRQSADGSSERELLIEGIGMQPSCSPDGKEIFINVLDPNLSVDIWVVPLEGKEKGQPRPFIQRNNNQRQGVWSPDGRWVAYSSDETRWWEVYVEPYQGPGAKIRISTMMAATIETEPEFRVTGTEVLFEGRYLTSEYHNYDVAPDGRFLMIQESEESKPPCIHVVLNWFEELKRLVPVEKD